MPMIRILLVALFLSACAAATKPAQVTPPNNNNPNNNNNPPELPPKVTITGVVKVKECITPVKCFFFPAPNAVVRALLAKKNFPATVLDEHMIHANAMGEFVYELYHGTLFFKEVTVPDMVVQFDEFSLEIDESNDLIEIIVTGSGVI